jgi:murein DD-endopeptidase MepM/ murein hydrolase activator NlpD
MDILGVGNQRFAELSSQITQDAIDSNNAVAQSAIAASEQKAATARGRAQGLADLTKAIGSFGEMQQREAQRRLQQIQSRQEQLDKVETAQASMEIEQLVANAPGYVKSKSSQAFESELHNRLGKYPHISPENAQKLFKVGYEGLGQVNKQIFDDVQQYTDEMNDLVMSQRKADLDIKISGITSRIKSSRGDTSQLFQKYDEEIKSFFNNPENAGLNPLQIASLQAHAMDKLAKASIVSQETRAMAEERAASANRFVNLYQQEYPKYANNPELWQARAYQIAQETGFPYEQALKISDPLQAQRIARDEMQTRRDINNLKQQRYINEANEIDHSNQAIGFVALNYLTDAEFATRIDNDWRYKDLIFYQAGKRVAEQLQDYRQVRQNSTVKLDSLAKSLSSWQSATNSYIMSNGEKGDIGNIINQFIDHHAATQPEVADRLMQLKESQPAPIDDPSWSPEQREMAKQAWEQWRQEGAKAIQRQMQVIESELEAKASALAPYGLADVDPNNPSNVEAMREAYRESQARIKELTRATPQGGVPQGANGNFNQGEPVSFYKAKNNIGNEMILPFRPGTKNVSIGHGWGPTGSPRHGRNRNHGGLDIAAPMGTPVISPVDGEVVTVMTLPNLGKFVDIKDNETGRIHRFAHASSINVQKGQKIGRGDEFMKVGSTGRSTGPHLHWELRSAVGGRFENTLDIETLATEFNDPRRVRKPRGDTSSYYSDPLNPYQTELDQVDPYDDIAISARALPLHNRYSVQDGTLYHKGDPVATTESAFTQSSPQKRSFQRYDKTGFNAERDNKPGNNYGYATLARNPNWSKKLNEVATRLGVPGVWLADVISFESGFRPSVDNGYDDDGDGHGYVGLIQFGAAAARDLGTTPQELKQMNFEEQMEYVYKYLNLPWFRGKLNTAGHVLAAVFGGPGLVNKLNNDSARAFRTGDINITFGNYLKRLGKDVGRQYNIPGLTNRASRMGSVIHERYHEGCPTCNAIAESGTEIYPHEAQR